MGFPTRLVLCRRPSYFLGGGAFFKFLLCCFNDCQYLLWLTLKKFCQFAPMGRTGPGFCVFPLPDSLPTHTTALCYLRKRVSSFLSQAAQCYHDYSILSVSAY